MIKSIILCDGDIPDREKILSELKDTDLFIAADGGANRAYELDLNPDIITGDFDSYIVTGKENATVIKNSDQETNDLEKALSIALKNNATDVIVFGATGKRVDHTLKNLSVLLQFNDMFRQISFKDQFSTLKIIESPFKEQYPLHSSLSLIPLSGEVTGLTTRGLRYPLNNESLKNGVRDGTSNETVEKNVEIEFKKGDLLLIMNHIG
tara:strand:- start:1614 stop:2237 length:624 start_codon:yes stop_codon:yes gene_type:complete